MDVKCERCNTEYEFDDALVSGRGTTVKCTNCGHKFKIRRNDGDFSEDFWNVTTGDGRTLVFTSLRELQRAIQGYLVERNDRLSRGGLPPKAIGQIPELAPFFEQREAAKRSHQQGRTAKTHDGLGPAAHVAATQIGVAPPPVRPRQATKPEFPAPPADGSTGKTTLVGTGPLTDKDAFPVMSAPPVSVPPPTVRDPEPPAAVSEARAAEASRPASSPPPRPASAVAPPPVPRPAASPAPPAASAPPRPPPSVAPATPPPPNRDGAGRSSSEGTRPGAESRPASHTVPIQRPTPPPVPSAKPAPVVSTPPPVPRRASDPGAESSKRESEPASATQVPPTAASTTLPAPTHPHRSLLAELEEERDRGRGRLSSDPDVVPPRRRSVGGFIVTAVVVGCLLMLGAVAAQKNFGPMFGAKPPAPAPSVDPRVEGFLSAGEKALADGNLELAKESFDKASALSERDPHVLLGVARLAAIRADVVWLKSRLLPPDAADDHRLTRDNLTELATTARKAADDALSVAAEDPRALRAKIDALRISGDVEGARALVGKIAASSTQPETAYVLAALDLAEPEPLWPTLIERLKTASSAETGPGRARAALVFALARSGDVAGAKAEIDRLAAMPRPHPLLPLLRGFADRAKPTSTLDAGVADAATAGPQGTDTKRPVTATHGGGGGESGGGGGAPPGDPRQLVAQAERARAKGDYERARTLYSAALDKNPNDSEALAGLAAIAYAQRDLAGARASYKRVLAINPNYMPALVGLADVEWDSGDKATAVKMYKDIIDRYPEGAYPGRIKQRIEGGG
jgi:predicted Zn finger-like uncharacterized protein